MAGINDLNLVDEDVPDVAPDDLPAQFSGFKALPQPGTYRLRLPEDLTSLWDVYDTDKGQRVKAIFKDENALRIIPSLEQFRTSVNNAERPRGKEKKLVSDLAYLLKALGHTEKVVGNTGYIKALSQYGGRDFRADVEWTTNCNPKADIWVTDPETGKTVKKDGVKGCGQGYATRAYTRNDGREVIQIPKTSEGFAETFECTCGANVRAFAQLSNFRAV